MRQFLWAGALILLTLGGNFSVKANPVSDIVESAANPTNYFVFGQVKTYYEVIDQLQSQQLEKQVLEKSLLDAEASLKNTDKDLAVINGQISALNKNIEALENTPEKTETESTKLRSLKTERKTLETQKAPLQDKIKNLEATLKASNLSAIEAEIERLEEEVNTSQLRIKSYAESLVKKIVLALSIWLFSFIIKWGITKIFNRLNFYVTPQRKAFVLQLIRLSINALTVLAILLVFFSQLIQALPYFAIFATALAFAMRDIILSVIAWIIIGTKDGYKVGHYLHIGTLWGTVVEINPFNTIVRQGGMSGQTGRLLTFPNKKIFEEFLENWSKLFNYTFLKWDFYLEQGSDIERAEQLLLKILEAEQAKFKDAIDRKKSQFTKKGLQERDLNPRIFWEIQANGILLRGKLLVDFDEFFEIRSAVTREFIMAVNKEKNIHLRFVNNLIPNQF